MQINNASINNSLALNANENVLHLDLTQVESAHF